MVYFVCEGCNETLKKNKVDAHAKRCRNCWAVSCVDCSVVFEGDDYAKHISCMTEAEKYEGSLYKPQSNDKNASTQKQAPQERWMDVIKSAAVEPSHETSLQKLLTRIASYDNVPRKKHKFTNFLRNSVPGIAVAMQERVWAIYEAAFTAQDTKKVANPVKDALLPLQNGTNNKNTSTTEIEELTEPPKKKQKTVSENDSSSVVNTKPIKWKKLIKAELKKASGLELDLNELQSKLVNIVQSKNHSIKSTDEINSEIKDAINNCSKFNLVQVVRLQKK